MTSEPERAHWLWISNPALSDINSLAGPLHTGTRSGAGWWTCARKTRAGDIAFLYRTASREPRHAREQRAVVAVLETLSDAVELPQRPGLTRGWKYGCGFQVLRRLPRPVGLDDLRAHPAFADQLLRPSALPLDPAQVDVMLGEIEVSDGHLRLPADRPPQGAFRREREMQFELLADLEVLRRVGVRPPQPGEIRISVDPDDEPNVFVEMPVHQDARRRRADIVIDEPGATGRRVVIELKHGRAGVAAIEQVSDYLEHIARGGIRRPYGLVVAPSFTEDARKAVRRRRRIELVEAEILGLGEQSE